MKNVKLKLAVLGTLSFVSAQAFATWEPLSDAPTGSAYINCFNDGRVIPPPGGPAVTAFDARANFGTLTPNGSTGVCEITGLGSEVAAPKTGYAIVTFAIRPIPPTTGGMGSIGSVLDVVWRKPANTAPVTDTAMCIFGARIGSLTNTDHDSGTGGTQYFEINDLARGGYSSSGTVNVAYFIQAEDASPVYRAGRSFTSVQHRALVYGGTTLEKQQNGNGYIDLPTIGGSPTLAINGVNSPIGPLATASVGSAADQDAQVNSNWVDFSLDAGFLDDDGGTNPLSAMTYVEAPCNDDSASVINTLNTPSTPGGWTHNGAISLRQTAQESTTFKAIDIRGYAPPGATIP